MATRSPASRPSDVRALAALPASTCRSTALYAMFSLPPTNHLAKGALDQSSTWLQRVSQCRWSACAAQKASRSSSASAYSCAVALAWAVNSALGGNVLLSVSRLSRVGPWPDGSVMVRDLLNTLHDRWAGGCMARLAGTLVPSAAWRQC